MKRVCSVFAMTAVIWWWGALNAGAQAAPAQIPAGSSAHPETDEAVLSGVISDASAPAVTPDTHSLSGGLASGIGSWGPRHSFLVPGWNVAEILDSNPTLRSPGTYRAFTSAAAQLQAVQYFGRSGEMRYAGAIRVDSSADLYGGRLTTNVHSVGLDKVFTAGRWSLLLDNQSTYSDGALFGDAGMEGLGSVVTELSHWNGAFGIRLGSMTLESGLTPEQSILTLRSGRLSEAALSELDGRLGDRTVVSVAANYGLLHFFSGDLIQGWQKGILTGLERQISARDRVGIAYGFTRLGFSRSGTAFTANSGMLLYGKRLSGRLTLQAGAGPEYLASVAKEMEYRDLNWEGRGSLTVRLPALDVQVGAMRMLTTGSGVLYGAHTNSAQASIGKNLSRTYSGWLSVGVARNTGILTGERYGAQFTTATLSHRVSRLASAFFTYNLQRQTADGCSVVSCAETGSRQVFGIGLSWTGRAIGVR